MRVAVPLRARPIAVLLLGAVALVACGEPPPPDLSGSRPVTFESRDGVTLEGRLFGDGSTGVVLSHMQPADQRSWFAFANRLADQGYLVLTYDFRGYCPGGEGGCSQGEVQIPAIWQDVLGAVDFIRSQGATTVALVGASMGGTASLVAAGQEGTDVAVVITLSAPVSIEGLERGRRAAPARGREQAVHRGRGGRRRRGVGRAALRDRSAAESGPEIVPADDHGTDLLTGSRGESVQRIIETYLAQFAPA